MNQPFSVPYDVMIGAMPTSRDDSGSNLSIPSTEDLTGPPVFREIILKSEKVPWAVRVYIGLFVMFVCLLLTAFFGMRDLPSVSDTSPAVKLFSFASDGLKTVLGALLGSLSVATEHYFRQTPSKSTQKEKGSS